MKMEYDIGTADIMNLRRNEMAQQNIYDNEIFFEGYKKIRDNKVNANNLFEIPALFSLLPDLTGKKILDLGCGFGEHCKQFIGYGAQKVVFSQEHPLCTCHSGGDRWTRDEAGNKLHLNLADYGIEGERESVWFVDDVKKYHRTFSTIINTLIEAGFTIEKMVEPLPTDEILEQHPVYRDLFHKPDFLLVRVRKQSSDYSVI